MAIEGMQPDGSWQAPQGSSHRSLTKQEVDDLKATAQKTKPVFGGEHNVDWAGTHPVAQEVYELRGLKPAE